MRRSGPVADLLDPGDAEWPRLLGRAPHDIYHLPGYVALEAARIGGEATALVVRDPESSLVIPLVVRDLPGSLGTGPTGARDATSPYGYPGPIVAGPGASDPAFIEAAVSAGLQHLAERNVCCAFVRLHPLLQDFGPHLALFGDVVEHGPTVWIDLTRSKDELWNQTRSRVRSYINRLKREGAAAFIDTEWRHLTEFISIYHETMRRTGAEQSYFFGDDYFSGLVGALGNRLRLCVVEVAGEVAGAGLFTEIDGTVEYHLGATADRFLSLSPSRLMFDFMRSWAKERGNTRLHLGGGVGGRRDSLFEFKAGFSTGRAVFSTWRPIIDAGTFDDAVQAWADRSGVAASPDPYFPPYRRPLPA